MGRLGASLDGAKLGSPSAGLPSPRGYSYHMQYCTFISQPARYVAYERGKDLSTSLPLTIWSSALHSWHTGLCVEGVPLRGPSILRLWRAPFGFIGRRPSGQARRLFGWSQTRESLCRTPVSKGLLVWHVIPCFRFSSCAFTRIRVRQKSYGFASDDDTDRCASLCYSILRRLQGPLG